MIKRIEYDGREVDRALNKLKTRLSTQTIVRINSLLGEQVTRQVVDQHLSGRPGLKRKTGTLARSIRWQIESANEVSIGSNVAYAAIHEWGGTITAKNGPFLRFMTDDHHWHMVHSVTIPARPYLRPGILETFEDGMAMTIIQKVLNEEIAHVWGR